MLTNFSITSDTTGETRRVVATGLFEAMVAYLPIDDCKIGLKIIETGTPDPNHYRAKDTSNGELYTIIKHRVGDGIQCGDIVTYETCFGNKELIFVGMADQMSTLNDCVVTYNGQPCPVQYSGLEKVSSK